MFVLMEQQLIQPPAFLDGFLTVKEYSTTKKVSVQAVYGKISRGTILIKRIGNFILVKDL